ncbi:hypothetical protein B0H11DRAFT_392311 [Mycena galericulata]|nr:hypothetical protein B0H11DRAFT_392311 [Mycena galericulata]
MLVLRMNKPLSGPCGYECNVDVPSELSDKTLSSWAAVAHLIVSSLFVGSALGQSGHPLAISHNWSACRPLGQERKIYQLPSTRYLPRLTRCLAYQRFPRLPGMSPVRALMIEFHTGCLTWYWVSWEKQYKRNTHRAVSGAEEWPLRLERLTNKTR